MSFEFPALESAREEIEQLRAELKAIFAEAGSDYDMSKVKSLTGTPAEKLSVVKSKNDRIEELQEEIKKLEHTESIAYKRLNETNSNTKSYGEPWSVKTSQTLHSAMGTKAVVSGSIDVPSPILTEVAAMARKRDHLLSHFGSITVNGNEYDYVRQTVRTNNAAPVADGALKPTSIYTVVEVSDRVRVLAHLSEPVPQRLFKDHASLQRFLEQEMSGGLIDAYEDQVVMGDGTGENMTGLFTVAGTQQQAYSNSVPETIRKALTVMQNAHEAPNLLAVNPETAEQLDLLETTDGKFLFPDGASYSNVTHGLPFTVSTSVPADQAMLLDSTTVDLVIREDARLDIDTSGENFTKNLATLRVEGRFGLAIYRPSALCKIDLAAE